ncbi:J domain-containing protein [Curvivirga sp.]|uniref:J domain-containing protein n=1 Tax=Curvivirga sp. TaxID=2856848 RepID=UPI003B593D1F
MPRPFTEKYPLGGRKHFRVCDHPDCTLEGEHRAPKSSNNLQDYFWFCLEHVREYNANWNFCEGMDQSDIDTMIKTDVCWGRPTWPLGNNGGHANPKSKARDASGRRPNFNGKIYDPFEIYEEATAHSAKAKKAKQDALRSHPEMEAYMTLGFDYPADELEVKARYKELAKDLHPDLNQDNPKAVERLKSVNQAYSRLKKSFS